MVYIIFQSYFRILFPWRYQKLGKVITSNWLWVSNCAISFYEYISSYLFFLVYTFNKLLYQNLHLLRKQYIKLSRNIGTTSRGVIIPDILCIEISWLLRYFPTQAIQPFKKFIHIMICQCGNTLIIILS